MPDATGGKRGHHVPHTEESRRKMSESHKRAYANGKRPGRWNAAKTHCPKGHPYDDENTYVRPDGGRECKKCARQRTRERRKLTRPATPPAPPRASRGPGRGRQRSGAHDPLVYYAMRDGMLKIGTTAHFRARMQELRVEEVLAVEPGGRDLERARHAEFAEYQVIHPGRRGARGGHHEWFSPGERLIAHAAALRDVHGVPDFSKRPRHGPYILSPEAAAVMALLPQPVIPLAPGTLERFVTRIAVDGECWRRSAAPDAGGYGQFYFEGTMRRSHRVSYMMFVGPIPDGLTIDHVRARGCRFRDCVRPSHLEAVTNRENVLRSRNMAAVNARVTHCPAGHAYTQENTYVIRRAGGRTARQCKTCTRARRAT